ncbi:Spy/CpxP family protein refolding chaperone [Niabella aquatica]
MTQSRSVNKVLVFIIILLLLTNILVVGYFLCFTKKKPQQKSKEKDGFAAVLRNEVGFNDDQVARFTELKKTYWNDAKRKMDEIVSIKNALFDLTRQEYTSDTVVEKLADSIGSLQKKVEINAYKHVKATRAICTPAQRPVYDSLMKRIINKGRSKRPGSEPPPEIKEK